MKMNFTLDHAVIMVDNLTATIKDYRTLGFTVIEGGKHPDSPTHNALVIFDDGLYLELIALVPGDDTPIPDRLRKWVGAGPGLVDFALLPGDIEADLAGIRQRGLAVAGPFPGGRLRPDGEHIAWQSAYFAEPGLPFFCADVTPRSLRVPEGEVRRHANGVTGLANLTVAVSDLTAGANHYCALLDTEPQLTATAADLEARITTFSLESTTITLAQPVAAHSPLHAYLAAGGERPYSITLRTAKTAAAEMLDPSLTHTARISLISN